MEVDRAELRASVEALAAIDRPAGSAGELQAAEWVADRLRALGCDVRVDEEAVHGPPWPWLTGLAALGVASGVAALRGRRLLGAAGAALAAAAIADDAGNGPRVARGAGGRRQRTWNVLAEAGDRDAQRTLLVLAHHDAPNAGLVFHPAPQRELHRLLPNVVDAIDTSIPLWWPVVGAPTLVSLGSLLGRRRLVKGGAAMGALSAALFADIARRGAVPAANDNASGVAGLIALAGLLRERPVEGLRVLLVSCGAEESFQEGIRAFARRHFHSLPPERTWVVNLETIGSPHLVLLEGEGPVRMEDFDEGFKDRVADVAERAGIPLRRGLRSSNSTDSVITHRAGYPTATLVSVTAWKALANYHWPTDVPENVDYDTVADAVRLTEAVIRDLAAVESPEPALAPG